MAEAMDDFDEFWYRSWVMVRPISIGFPGLWMESSVDFTYVSNRIWHIFKYRNNLLWVAPEGTAARVMGHLFMWGDCLFVGCGAYSSLFYGLISASYFPEFYSTTVPLPCWFWELWTLKKAEEMSFVIWPGCSWLLLLLLEIYYIIGNVK